MTRGLIRRQLVFIVIVALMLSLDLWSKSEAVERLDGANPGRARYSVIDGVVEFRLVYNPGMMWGMAQDVSQVWWIVIRGSVLAALFWLYATLDRRGTLTQVAFGLVVAGAAGNIYDNAFFQPPNGGAAGQVRDFIHFYWFEFPTFNVADSCICVGAPLLLCVLWNHDREKARQNAEKPEVTN
ncbi:MAG: signal peptidase II [Planctomycetes bacterium]|nr:signal peptidase II [Planctomycetota bacterium]